MSLPSLRVGVSETEAIGGGIETQRWSESEWRAFPPLYTLQPVEETRRQQLQIWVDLVHSWSRKQNLNTFPIANAEIFENEGIRRKLDEEGERAVIDALIADGRAELVNNGKDVQIYQRRPPELAHELHEWISTNNMLNTVFTIYELYDVRTAIPGSPCRGLNPVLVRRSIQLLQADDKALIFQGSTTNDDGVKFFSVDADDGT